MPLPLLFAQRRDDSAFLFSPRMDDDGVIPLRLSVPATAACRSNTPEWRNFARSFCLCFSFAEWGANAALPFAVACTLSRHTVRRLAFEIDPFSPPFLAELVFPSLPRNVFMRSFCLVPCRDIISFGMSGPFVIYQLCLRLSSSSSAQEEFPDFFFSL